MNMNRQYACHRIYDGGNHTEGKTIVSIAPNGEVESYFPLTKEIPFTEWIGGIIVLSNQAELPCLPDFPTWIHRHTIDKDVPVYAFHISNFDFQQERLTAQSIIRRL